MQQSINRLARTLKAEYAAMWALLLAVVALGETGVIPNGLCAAPECRQAEYQTNAAAIVATLLLVPLSIKLFTLNTTRNIHRYTLDTSLRSYHVWSLVRLAMLYCCMALGVACHYLTLTPTGLLCAAIAMLAALYCWPTAAKVRQHVEDTKADTE